MYTNVNLAAPVGALLLLGTAVLLFVIAITLVYSLAKKRSALTKLALVSLLAVSGLYLAVLLIFSFTSTEKVLALSQEKYFCEIDCHLAYSVTNVRETAILRNAPNQLIASGAFRLVTVKTRFDEKTISAKRGDGLLYPNSRVVMVRDEQGKLYFPSAEAQSLLAQTQSAGTAMTTPLRPGESYSTTLVFDLPETIRNPTMLIREGETLTRFVIGHENSPLHKKTRFQI